MIENENIMDDWQRLEQLIKWTGHSVNAFALGIGLKRSENIYQIKKGNHGISKELAELITAKYSSVSKGWLLAGEGEMFVNQSPSNICGTQACPMKPIGIPFYNIDAATLKRLDDMSSQTPLYHMDIPSFESCDFAIKNTGNSMDPEIPNGAIVVLKSIDKSLFMPGEAYLVVTNEFSVIRYVRSVKDNPANLLLVPLNTADFDPIEIASERIDKIFVVAGVLITRVL